MTITNERDKTYGEFDVINALFVLLDAKVEAIQIDEELWQTEELGYQLCRLVR